MSRPQYDIREVYNGNDVITDFTFDFKITNLGHLLVLLVNISDSLVDFSVRATDTTYFTTTINTDTNGGKIIFPAPVPTGKKLVILLADDVPIQGAQFSADSRYTMKKIEQSFDNLGGQIQRIKYQLDRSLRIPEKFTDAFNSEINDIIASAVVMIDETGTKFMMVPRSEFKGDDGAAGVNPEFFIAAGVPDDGDGISGDLYFDTLTSELYQKTGGIWLLRGIIAATGVPAAGLTHSVLAKVTDADGDAGWTAPIAYHGISARFGSAQFDADGIKETLDKIIQITYTSPSISLSGSSNILREKGNTVTSITLTANTTKRSNDIATVRFYQGGTLLDTQAAGPGNGSNNTTYSTPFSDNISFTAQVDDINFGGAGPSTSSANTGYSFVYPYYVGAGATGKSAAQIRSDLTLTIIGSTGTVVRTITAAATNVFYFAYPSAYGSLTSILDVNNFETIGDWTKTTKSITGLDATSQSYFCYEFNNPVTAGSYQYTFKR